MKKIFYIFALIILGFIVFANTFSNDFLWDDEVYITTNEQVHELNNIPNFFLQKTPIVGPLHSPVKNLYRPLAFTVWNILYVISDGTPFLFHLFQITLHIANAVLLFLILFLFWRNINLTFVLSLVFLIHPINTESVNFMSAILEPSYVFFGLSGLYLLIKSKILGNAVLISSALFLASSLFKESGIIFFVIAAIYIWLFRQNELRNIKILILFIALYFFLRLIVAHSLVQIGPSLPIVGASLSQRIMTLPKIIYFYISTLLYPKDLSILRQWVVTTTNYIDFWRPLSISIGFFTILIFSYFKSRNNIFGFFLLIFFLSFITYFQFIPLTMTVAERWFYLPFMGIIGMLGILTKTKRLRKIFIITMFIIIPVLALRTIQRNSEWRSGLTLFSNDNDKDKHSYDFENNYGVELIRVGMNQQAKIHLLKSVSIAPNWWIHHNNLGVIYQAEGNFSEAERSFLKSIKNGDYELAYENYIQLLINEKKYDQAKKYLNNEALKKYPNNSKLHQFSASLSTI